MKIYSSSFQTRLLWSYSIVLLWNSYGPFRMCLPCRILRQRFSRRLQTYVSFKRKNPKRLSKSFKFFLSIDFSFLTLTFYAACPEGTYKPNADPGDIRSCLKCPHEYQTSPRGSNSLAMCTCKENYFWQNERL